jgi:hypothetical protein
MTFTEGFSAVLSNPMIGQSLYFDLPCKKTCHIAKIWHFRHKRISKYFKKYRNIEISILLSIYQKVFGNIVIDIETPTIAQPYLILADLSLMSATTRSLAGLDLTGGGVVLSVVVDFGCISALDLNNVIFLTILLLVNKQELNSSETSCNKLTSEAENASYNS